MREIRNVPETHSTLAGSVTHEPPGWYQQDETPPRKRNSDPKLMNDVELGKILYNYGSTVRSKSHGLLASQRIGEVMQEAGRRLTGEVR